MVDNSVISMQEAVTALAKGQQYKQRKDLSDDQKFLIGLVAEERKSAEGKALTDKAAEDGIRLWIHDDGNPKWGGTANYGNKLIVLKNRNADYITLHHELTHIDQGVRGVDAPPKELSSYDKTLWSLGKEGQAYVAQADEEARRNHTTLTDAQKREIFSKAISDDYAGFYGSLDSTRTDGQQLKGENLQKYENAFGFVPGHKEDGNFLISGAYTDAANILKVENPQFSPFEEAKREAGQPPMKYEDLPVAGALSDNVRFDSKDKSYVILVAHTKGSDDANIKVYRKKHLPGGDAYVLADDSNVKVEEAKKWNIAHKGDKNAPVDQSWAGIYEEPTAGSDAARRKQIVINVKRDGQVTAKGYDFDDSNPADDGKDYPLEKHQNTMRERLTSPSIKDMPAPAPANKDANKFLADGQQSPSDPQDGNGLGLPENAKVAALAAGDPARKLGTDYASGDAPSSADKGVDIAALRDATSGMISGGHEAASPQNNAYINNAVDKGGAVRSV